MSLMAMTKLAVWSRKLPGTPAMSSGSMDLTIWRGPMRNSL
jgi:hypothetical protein